MTVDRDDILGKPLARIEDPPLVTGRGRFVGDIDFPGQLHMRMVRSPHAHAGIGGIDAAAALALEGVRAVWSAADIAEIPPIDFRSDRQVEALKPYRQHVLARDRARYVGEPVAAVFAETPYGRRGRRRAGRRRLRTASRDRRRRRGAGRVRARSRHRGRRCSPIPTAMPGRGSRRPMPWSLSISAPDAIPAFPMETRGAIGVYDAARDRLELHGAAKVPHRNKETLIRMLGLAPERIHLFEGHVGGGFGIRGELYPEDLLVLLAARRFARPVKWIEDRQEHLMAANQGREQRHKARLAVDAEGRILALETEIWHDQGAYLRTHGVSVPNRSMCSLPGLYRVPAFRASCHVRLTNKTPAATYRAPGRFESSFVRERLMDAAAHRLGIDPVEIRRRNLIAAADLPYTVAYDEPYAETLPLDSGDYPLLLRKALEAVGWEELQAGLARRREAGELVGAGLATFLEESGRGPSDGARIAVDGDGGVEVVTGGASVGQGFATAMAPDLRRDPRCRLSRHLGRARSDRPDSLRHRRPCRPRDGVDRKRRARDGARGARQGARGGVRALADARRAARDPRRDCAGGRRRPVHFARRDRAGPRPRCARRGRVPRNLAMHLPLRRPHRRLPRRSRHRGGDGRAVPGGLRRRAGGQRRDAGGAAGRRLRPGDRRCALRGVRV